MELSVNVSTNNNWWFNWLHITFFNKDLFNFLAKNSELSFWKDRTFLYSFEPIVDVLSTHFIFKLIINTILIYLYILKFY